VAFVVPARGIPKRPNSVKERRREVLKTTCGLLAVFWLAGLPAAGWTDEVISISDKQYAKKAENSAIDIYASERAVNLPFEDLFVMDVTPALSSISKAIQTARDTAREYGADAIIILAVNVDNSGMMLFKGIKYTQ